MLHIIVGVFLILHGLVHLMYVGTARGWIPSNGDTIWDGRSWVFTRTLGASRTMTLATIVHTATTLVFAVAGIGLVAKQPWWEAWAVAGAILSTAGIVLFWDGSPKNPVQKGLLGIVINVAILAAVLYFGWPSI